MPDDALTEISKATKDEVVFFAKYGKYRIVRSPRVRTYNEVGQAQRDIPAIRYEWSNNVLRVRPGRNRRDDDQESQLAEGQETGVERDDVEYLKAHRDFDNLFWIDGEEPNRPRPFDHEVLKAISDAAVNLDVERLQALFDAERSTHNRPLLIGALQSALEAISRAAAEQVAREDVPVSGDAENALEWAEQDSKDDLQALADQLGLDVKGTGADGAVVKGDLVKALRRETRAQEKQS